MRKVRGPLRHSQDPHETPPIPGPRIYCAPLPQPQRSPRPLPRRRGMISLPTRIHLRAPPLCVFLYSLLIRRQGVAKITYAATCLLIRDYVFRAGFPKYSRRQPCRNRVSVQPPPSRPGGFSVLPSGLVSKSPVAGRDRATNQGLRDHNPLECPQELATACNFYQRMNEKLRATALTKGS